MSLQEAVNTKSAIVSTLAVGATGSTASYWIDLEIFNVWVALGAQVALLIYMVFMIIVTFPKVLRTLFPKRFPGKGSNSKSTGN